MGEVEKITFQVVGMVVSPEFQKCKHITERYFRAFPKIYDIPKIRPMLNSDWCEYLTKVRRKYGGRLWQLVKPVAVFVNGNYLGDDADLEKYVSHSHHFSVVKNLQEMGQQQLIEIIQKSLEAGRKFVYLTISVDNKVVGTMLFLLYSDMVPKTCANFIKRCKSKRRGYQGTPVHRIAKSSWIQVGDYTLKSVKVSCENYTVPHNRRGVLSMANAGRHQDNSTQFLVALNPTPWMDYRYVAFGQLVHGEEVLQAIENVPARYESPNLSIQIVRCDEFLFGHESKVDKTELRYLDEYGKTFDRNLRESPGGVDDTSQTTEHTELLFKDVVDDRDIDSIMYESRYTAGLYAHDLDLRSYHPFLHVPDDLLLDMIHDLDEEEEGCYTRREIEEHLALQREEIPRPTENQRQHPYNLLGSSEVPQKNEISNGKNEDGQLFKRIYEYIDERADAAAKSVDVAKPLVKELLLGVFTQNSS